MIPLPDLLTRCSNCNPDGFGFGTGARSNLYLKRFTIVSRTSLCTGMRPKALPK